MKVYEAGATVGANVRDWGHVRLFSPWDYNIDAAAARAAEGAWLAGAAGRRLCRPGADLYDAYLKPLAATPEMAAVIETGASITAITRHGADKVLSQGRETKPFVLAVSNGNGAIRRDLARAVIDASGTWAPPNPLGAGGVPAEGEAEHADRIAYGIPDVLGRDRRPTPGKTVAGRRRRSLGRQRAPRPRPAGRAGSRDARRMGDARRQPDRASMAAARPTSCPRAASSARTSRRWSTAGASPLVAGLRRNRV